MCCRYVVRDKDQDVLYDVLMSKVDVRVGEWGLYNFYKMQVRLSVSSQAPLRQTRDFGVWTS